MNIEQQIEEIYRSGLFDEVWYRLHYGDVPAGIDAIEHYVRVGLPLGRAPNLTSKDRFQDLTVLQLTPPKPRNPFYTMINDALASRGAVIHYGVDHDEALRLSSRAKSLVVHVHQLEPLYHPGERTVDAVSVRAEALLSFLRNLKGASTKVVWTKHNPLPHNRQFAEVDAKVEREVLDLVDKVVLLSEGAKLELAHHADKLTYVPHPEFKSFYGPKVEKVEARQILGLPDDAFIFACIGELKPYKLHKIQIEAFQDFCAQYTGSKNPFLLFVGNPGPPDYVQSLARLASDRIRIIPKDIPNDQMRYWMSAVDASLFAFGSIWVSGSVLLSLSYDVPAIVPDLGYLDEYVSEENTGFFYTANEVAGMTAAMLEVVNTPFREHIEYMCGVFRKKNALQRAADGYHEVFLSALEG